MKKKISCVYDTQESNKVELSNKKFIKKIKEFFVSNADMKENETFYVVKAFIDKDKRIHTHGAYYGTEMSPLDLLVNSENNSEEVFLAEATSSDAMLEFIESSEKTVQHENIYIFKVLFENFELSKIQSFYGGENILDLYLFHHDDEEDSYSGEVLKRFGKVDYVPSLSFY